LKTVVEPLSAEEQEEEVVVARRWEEPWAALFLQC